MRNKVSPAQRLLHRNTAIVLLLAVSACGGPSPSERIRPQTQPTEDLRHSGHPSATATQVPTLGPAPDDLRDVDWQRVPMPAAFCGVVELVRFENGVAVGMSQTYGRVEVYQGSKPVYGDIDGDRHVEAIIGLECHNGGGTASGQLGFAEVVIRGLNGQLTVIGTITPQYSPAASSHVSFIAGVRIQRGKVVADETWYRPSDPTCCPTGRATTVWTLSGDTLTPGAPRVGS